jgi:hypothetical protein
MKVRKVIMQTDTINIQITTNTIQGRLRQEKVGKKVILGNKDTSRES